MAREHPAEPDALERLVARFFEEERRLGSADIEEFAGRFPEHGEELRDVLAGMQLMERAADAFGAEDALRELDTLAVLGGARRRLQSVDTRRESPADDDVSELLSELSSAPEASQRLTPEGEIARGGQGAVFAVWDGRLRRHLAMKVTLAPGEGEVAQTPRGRSSLTRFLDEARVTAQLDHPGIVPVHDLGMDPEKRVYFTMKLVKGRELHRIFDLARSGEEGWSSTRALNVLLRVCEAMAYAHAKGVIHRDLKPSNVMVGKFGEVYVMDWGLARVTGREDEKDLRIQPAATTEIHTLRGDDPDDLDSPLVTMDGDVVGTPAYMSPEQASGELGSMGPHSDVYAVGAMLYQLLTGEMPYVPSGSRLGSRKIWALVQAGPPAPVQARAREAAPELVAICEKAMARTVGRRYADMGELAEDLRAFLEHRVVRAYETGAVAELRKWVGRNRPFAGALAAGVLAVVAGLAASWFLKEQSDDNAALAESEKESVFRLSALQNLEELQAEAEELWPPWPEHLERYDDWLRGARELVAGLEPDPATGDVGHRARLAELEARALPESEPDRRAEDRSHPRYPELVRARGKLGALERAREVREGRAAVEEVELDLTALPENALALEGRAQLLTAPYRVRFGREAEGLALARLALERVEDAASSVLVSKTLAWALFANGMDDEAIAELDLALSTAPESFRVDLESTRGGLLERMAEARSPDGIRELRGQAAELEALVSRRTLRFERDEDEWWHDQLLALVEGLEALADPETGLIEGRSPEFGLGVARRLVWADGVVERTISGAGVAARWKDAIASIADPEVCPAYHGLSIEPQLGLVPLGPDPESGLWEFGHPLTGEVPVRDDEGRLVLDGASSLVFVLVPGGSFRMGAQLNPRLANYDPQAQADEIPVRLLDVSPFFLSKCETTQGQWERFTGVNPSWYGPGVTSPVPEEVLRDPLYSRLLHPVEQVTWYECVATSRRMGLMLPVEMQWEYAARAGTTTPWWTGATRDNLAGTVNLADRSAAAFPGNNWPALDDWPELDDGCVGHAPVNLYRANPFGFHSVNGNVREWCGNAYDITDSYDPWHQPSENRNPAIRGSAYQWSSLGSRSSARSSAEQGWSDHTTGVRLAREIRYALDVTASRQRDDGARSRPRDPAAGR